MARIIVFDSGLGSLSVIKSIQKQFKCDIVYFADSKNFPYGKKSIKELHNITLNTINKLQKFFEPDAIIVGSNTLSLTLNSHFENIWTVLPPINDAKKITKTKSIAILATKSIVESKLLEKYFKNFQINALKITKINATPLVELVESGKFYSKPKLCENIIKKTLTTKFLKNNIDVVILSSTHLPLLQSYFQNIFPGISFIEPSELLSKKLKQKYSSENKKRNTLQIFTSGNVISLENKLRHMGIKNKISNFSINEH